MDSLEFPESEIDTIINLEKYKSFLSLSKKQMSRKHNPRSFLDFLKLIGLTLLTAVVYVILKIQGKLRM
jgi:hypothetical protein